MDSQIHTVAESSLSWNVCFAGFKASCTLPVGDRAELYAGILPL
jgi:hypothetical protein